MGRLLASGIFVAQFVTMLSPAKDRRPAMYERLPSTAATLSAAPSFKSTTAADPIHYLFTQIAADGFIGGIHGMYQIAALYRALTISPLPLLTFAATRDYTAENIIFLIHVREWRRTWRATPRDIVTDSVAPDIYEELLRRAIDIYSDCVCSQTATYPINIDDSIAKDLRSSLASHRSALRKRSADSRKRKGALAVQSADSVPEIPIDEHLFDAADSSIMYLVLCNTWRRFVGEQEMLFRS